ncbi:MAG: hypothetical protein C0602_01675 [Denitrovibrio sp.]|nr:MAG: hypothetical protein C0602_01675 [Denitrovibrio sp.]
MKDMNAKQAFNLGRSYHEKGNLAQAEKIYEAVLQVDPHHAEATHNLGMIFAARGLREEAIEYVKRSLELDGSNPNFHNNMGELYRIAGQIEHAQFHLSAACELKPGFSEAFSNLGIIHMEKGEIDDAKYCFAEALASNPKNVNALINTGNLFRKTGNFNDAIECYEAVLELSPDNPTALICAAISHNEIMDYNNAAKYYSRLVANRPELQKEKLALAEITLRNKDFRKGLKLYEARFNVFNILKGDRETLWRGTGLEGKTLYVYYEDTVICGLGDTILFCRYLHELEKFNPGKVVLQLQPELAELFEGQMPDFVELTTEDVQEFDVHSPLLSLPMILNARAKTIPLANGYLKAEPANRETDKIRIGYAFNENIDQNALSLFEADDRVEIFPLEGTMKEKADKAASADLVITSDNEIVHLAGAMGIKTCLLLEENHHWRWFRAKTEKTSEWYSSVTFYIKEKGADWLNVISSIKV